MPRQKSIPKKVEVGGMTLDLENACLKKNGGQIHLTTKETKLMALLEKNHYWGDDFISPQVEKMSKDSINNDLLLLKAHSLAHIKNDSMTWFH